MPGSEDESGPTQLDPVAKGCGVGCLAVLALFAAFLVYAFSTSDDDGDESGYAKVACEGFVEDRLRSPASADFSDTSVVRAGDTYTVTGAVDSQNGFGAMIRNTYRCEVSRVGDDQWRLESVSGLSN